MRKLIALFFILTLQIGIANAHEDGYVDEVVIEVSDEGFDPQKVTVIPNTNVVFVNVGNELQWPAGNDHPSHTLYDGTTLEEHCAEGAVESFDACEAINPGERYSFHFDEEGTYEYHDHIWPHLTGEITVAEEKKNGFIDMIVNFFKRIGEIFKSIFQIDKLMMGTDERLYVELKEKYSNMVLEKDAREAILALEDESAEDPKVEALCHDILHVIGHTGYDKYGSFEEGVKYQEDFCNSGYIHGLFESYFEEESDPLTNLASQCANYAAGKRPFDLWQCYHGVGHGFMYLKGGDLNESLELCTDTLDDRGDRSACYNGVYMEVFNFEMLAKEEIFVDKNDPGATCKWRTSPGNCYIYLPTFFIQREGMDFEEALEACMEIDEDYQDSCVRGAGGEAMKRNMQAPEKVFELCQTLEDKEYQEYCIAGAAGIYSHQKTGYEPAVEMCEDAPEDLREACLKTAKAKKSFFESSL